MTRWFWWIFIAADAVTCHVNISIPKPQLFVNETRISTFLSFFRIWIGSGVASTGKQQHVFEDACWVNWWFDCDARLISKLFNIYYNYTVWTERFMTSGGSASNEPWWRGLARFVSQLEIQYRNSYLKTGWRMFN